MALRFWSRPKDQEPEQRSYSVSDPALAAYFNINPGFSGISVNEYNALGLSAIWRAVSLISGTIASLPLRTLRELPDGTRQRVPSLFDDPGQAVGMTRFEWIETVLVHLVLHGNAFLAHVYNGAGALAGLWPIHPLCITVEWEKDAQGNLTGGKVFRASLPNGTQRTFTQDDLTHIPAMSGDGLYGYSLVQVAKNSLGTGIAADRAAARLFGSGATISGLVTTEQPLTEDEARAIKESFDARVTGVENSGGVAFINRDLKFTPWTMTAEDAQWIQSRSFQIEEVSRWTGVPPHLLGQSEKSTSWGTGIEEQNRALARTVLAPWAKRIEERLSRLLPTPRFVEFDFTGLERPNPETEIGLVISQVQAGLITVNEARRLLRMDPIDGGDSLASGNDTPQDTPPVLDVVA